MCYGACWAARRKYDIPNKCISNCVVHEMNSYRTVQYLSNKQLHNLVASLNALHEGKTAIPLLFIAGERAIHPLREILLEEGVNRLRIPRPQVVCALAELGAREVLLEYLLTHRTPAGPDRCQTEAALRSAVTRALTAWDNQRRCAPTLQEKTE